MEFEIKCNYLDSLLNISVSVMRLGKKKEKEKESEPKCQQVDGVTRLICSAKTQNIPLRGKKHIYNFNFICI
jgi:hypothetical protein